MMVVQVQELLIGFCATATVKMRINVNSVWRVRIRSGIVINIERAHLITAMMRYRGGRINHKSICEATRCLLDNRDPLDKVPFTRDSEKDRTAQNSDDGMMRMVTRRKRKRARVTTSSVTMAMNRRKRKRPLRRLLGLKTAKRVCQMKARRSVLPSCRFVGNLCKYNTPWTCSSSRASNE
jgi:hypothetical protein